MEAKSVVTYRFSKKLDPGVAAAAREQLDELSREFPKIKFSVEDSELADGSYAESSFGPFGPTVIYITNRWTIPQWDERMHQDIATGFHPVGFDARGSVQGVMAHEFGHLLSYTIGIFPHGVLPILTIQNWLTAESGDELKTVGAIASAFSRYATDSPHEFLSEAFAEYHQSPETVRKLPAAIASRMVAMYHALGTGAQVPATVV